MGTENCSCSYRGTAYNQKRFGELHSANTWQHRHIGLEKDPLIRNIPYSTFHQESSRPPSPPPSPPTTVAPKEAGSFPVLWDKTVERKRKLILITIIKEKNWQYLFLECRHLQIQVESGVHMSEPILCFSEIGNRCVRHFPAFVLSHCSRRAVDF